MHYDIKDMNIYREIREKGSGYVVSAVCVQRDG